MYRIFWLFFTCNLIAGDILITSFVHNDEYLDEKWASETELTIQGIIIVGNSEDINLKGYDQIRGLMCYHIDLPTDITTLGKSLNIARATPLTREKIIELRENIENYFLRYGHPVAFVSVVDQDFTTGVVQIQVQKSKLNNLTCTGNKWFLSEKIKQAIQIKKGDPISLNLLNKNLYWLNKNPFRHIDSIFAQSEQENQIDIELLCKDRYPLRGYAGTDNTGNDVTGNNRLFAGFTWGNVFSTNQILSYQFTSSIDFKRLNIHTVSYDIPINPWQHLINIFGGYSSVDADFFVPNIIDTKFRTHGFSLQGSLRYTIPLNTGKQFLHEALCGFDFKRTNNNLDLGGVPIISNNNINLTQFQCAYNLGYQYNHWKISFEIEGFYSPGEWVADQTNADYQSLRAFSKHNYLYFRSASSFVYTFDTKWKINNYLRAQLASCNLLPSEEFGLGGLSTVRGYKERIVNGDDAFVWNFELCTPPVSIYHNLGGKKNINDALTVLGFFDYGIVSVKKTVEGQDKSTFLMSSGPALRYDISTNVMCRLDWGLQLKTLDLNEPSQRLSFSLSMGY